MSGKTQEESRKSRNDIQASFEATSALLNSLSESNADNEAINSKVSTLHGSIDNLMAGLVKDERSLYSSLAESYSKGELNAEAIKELIQTETKRTGFMTKMTAALKVQLEQVFTVVEKLGDVAEKSTSDKVLQKEINGLYLDFADLTSTVDNLTQVVKAPGKGVGEKISEFKYEIETTLSTSPVALRRASSIPTNGISVSTLKTQMQESVPEEQAMTTTTEAHAEEKTTLVAGDWADDDIEIKQPIRVTALVDRSSQTGPPAELSDIGIGVSRPPTDKNSAENAAVSTKGALKPTSGKAGSRDGGNLVVMGTKPMSSAEIAETTRLQQHLTEKEMELVLRENLLMDHHKVLDARADELRSIAHKVVLREDTLQKQIADINRTVNERVEIKIQAALAQRVSKATKGAEGTVVSTSELDETREFIEENMQQAQAQHAATPAVREGATSTLVALTDEYDADPAFGEDAGKDGVRESVDNVMGGILAIRGNSTPPVRASPLSSRNASPEVLSRKGLTSGSRGDVHTPAQLDAPLPNPLSHEGQLDLHMRSTSDVGAPGSVSMPGMHLDADDVSLPPPTGKVSLPQMIVIFPPKTREQSTMTDYIKSESGTNAFNVRLSGDAIKTVFTTRAGKGSRGTYRGNGISKDSSKAAAQFKKDRAQGLTTVTESDSSSVESTASEPSNIRKGPLQLVDRDEMGVLMTRTYRHIPPRDFHAVLRECDNPLLEMVHEYGGYIDDVYKAALQQAAGVSAVTTANARVITKLFEVLIPDLEKLDASMLIVLKEIARCEELANNMIVVKGTGDISDAHYRRSLQMLFSKFGEVESMKMWVDMQLSEYRVVFDRVGGLGVTSMPSLLRQSDSRTAFNNAANVLTSVSGRSAEAGSRFKHLKDRCARYDVASSYNPGFSQYSGGGAGDVSFEDYLNLQSEVESLRDMLKEAEEENEELNLEVFRVMQEKDRTPAALMFFSVLQDPVTTSVLHQLSLQLTKLKAFSEGDEHLEFASLRKRLQVCISCTPTMDRLVQRYNALHKKWSVNRLASFMNKGLTGGGADSANMCPLCNNDPAATLVPAGKGDGDGGPVAQSPTKGNRGTKQPPTGQKKIIAQQTQANPSHNAHTRHIKAKPARPTLGVSQSMTDSTMSEGTALPSISIPHV